MLAYINPKDKEIEFEGGASASLLIRLLDAFPEYEVWEGEPGTWNDNEGTDKWTLEGHLDEVHRDIKHKEASETNPNLSRERFDSIWEKVKAQLDEEARTVEKRLGSIKFPFNQDEWKIVKSTFPGQTGDSIVYTPFNINEG